MSAVVFAACAVGAAVFYFTGDACESSARIEALYIVPLLMGVASFLFVASTGPRWWLGFATGGATMIASSGLLVFLAFVHYDLGGCYT